MSRTQSDYLITIPLMTTYHDTRGLIRLCHELYQVTNSIRLSHHNTTHDHISRTATKKIGYHQILPTQEDWSDYVTNSIKMPNVMTTYHELLRKNSAITKYYQNKRTDQIMSRTLSRCQMSWPHITNCYEKIRPSPNITDTMSVVTKLNELDESSKYHELHQLSKYQLCPYVTNSISHDPMLQTPSVMTTCHELNQS